MDRWEVLRLAETAVWGKPTPEVIERLDTAIREAAVVTGRTVSETADLLRAEAWAGDHYRGETYDR